MRSAPLRLASVRQPSVHTSSSAQSVENQAFGSTGKRSSKLVRLGTPLKKQVLNRAGRILGAHPLAEPVGSRGHRCALTRIAAFAIALISVLLAARNDLLGQDSRGSV